MQNCEHANYLINESSPYLLQHASNPVNWYPWGDLALEKALREDKLLLVSIGYAACHWCHVMEHECFQDEEVAQLMNEHYISIKVDREERPDIDHFFMTAVHLTGSRGGWPLNCIALPDGRPLWGGTYFPKDNWMNALTELNRIYRTQREETVRHAEKLSEGIRQASLVVSHGSEISATSVLIDNAVVRWSHHFDKINGGQKGKPKFPMPVNLSFLLHYSHARNNAEIIDYVHLTLERMAMGGIYDHAGGGFARYSTDESWKIPHFEKMLYDNAQLLSLYAKAHLLYRNPHFKSIVYETAGYLEREMLHPEGAFYSSLDADSEGTEGLFYTWTIGELNEIFREEFGMFAAYYNANNLGHWEDGRYILLRSQSDEDFALQHGTSVAELKKRVENWKSVLMKHRGTRVRPGLDDKILTSWNALAIEGLCHATMAFGDDRFRNMALRNAHFIKNNLFTPEGGLYHTWKPGKDGIPGFLEDYSLVIQAFLSLSEITTDENWAVLARKLSYYVMEHFYDADNNLFLFSKKGHKETVENHFQTEDNVIASSNSTMAVNLLKLSRLFSDPEPERMARLMARKFTALFSEYPYAYANWGRLLLMLTTGILEVAVTGEKAPEMLAELQNQYLPTVVWASARHNSELPLLKNRFVKGKTLIYVCSSGRCSLPVESQEAARELIRKA